jgi:hypothetical protein
MSAANRSTPSSRRIPVRARPTRTILGALLSLVILAGCGSAEQVTTTNAGGADGGTSTTASSRGSLAPAAVGGACDETNPATGEAISSSAPASETRESFSRFFSGSSPWNEQVDNLPSEPGSARLMGRAGEQLVPVEQTGRQGIKATYRTVRTGLTINTCSWTDPIVTEQGGRPTRVFCRQAQCGPDAAHLTTLPIPADVNPDPRYDGWFTLVDGTTDVAYDFWRARRQADGSISYAYVKKWSVDGAGYQAPYQVSARGSGLPLFAGEITLADLRSGQIDHALAISVPGAAEGSFVAPASSTDGDGPVGSLPEGARIRLRPGVRLHDLPGGADGRIADAIVAALVRYGAIVVDRSVTPTLYAQRDVSGRYVIGNELRSLHLDDFEVVALPRRYEYPAGTNERSAAGLDGAQAAEVGGEG